MRVRLSNRVATRSSSRAPSEAVSFGFHEEEAVAVGEEPDLSAVAELLVEQECALEPGEAAAGFRCVGATDRRARLQLVALWASFAR